MTEDIWLEKLKARAFLEDGKYYLNVNAAREVLGEVLGSRLDDAVVQPIDTSGFIAHTAPELERQVARLVEAVERLVGVTKSADVRGEQSEEARGDTASYLRTALVRIRALTKERDELKSELDRRTSRAAEILEYLENFLPQAHDSAARHWAWVLMNVITTGNTKWDFTFSRPGSRR